jgi:UPF0716 family protein affecting phage T7 exclusion
MTKGLLTMVSAIFATVPGLITSIGSFLATLFG